MKGMKSQIDIGLKTCLGANAKINTGSQTLIM